MLLGAVGPTIDDGLLPGFARSLRDEGYEVIVLGAQQSYDGIAHAAIDEDVDLVIAIDDSVDHAEGSNIDGVDMLVARSDTSTSELLAQAAGRRRQM